MAVPISSASMGSGGIPFVDAYNKTRSPSPIQLAQSLIGLSGACGALNAEGVASATLRLYVKTTRKNRKSYCIESGRTKDIPRRRLEKLAKTANGANFLRGATKVEEVDDHPLLDLLNKPNDVSDDDGVGMSLFHLLNMTQLYLESVGRAYWYVPRDGMGGTPSELWILPAQYVQEMPDLSGKTVIESYRYTGSTLGKTDYQPNEIIAFRCADLSTGGYMGGKSPLRDAFEQVQMFRQFDAHTNALLRNAGRPDMLWSAKGDSEGGGIGENEVKRLRNTIAQSFGMSGRGGMAFADTPGTITPLTWPNNEILTADQYKQIKTLIANCFQVPTTKLDRNESNLASAKTGDYAHAKDAILPRCRRIEAAINTFLLPMYDPDGQMFVAFDSPVPDDEMFELEQSKAFAASGAMLRNEQRAMMGLDPVAWGDQPLADGRMVAVDLKTGIPATPPKLPKDQQDDAPTKAMRRAELARAL